MVNISINGTISKVEDTVQIKLDINVSKVTAPVRKQEVMKQNLITALVQELVSQLDKEQ